MALPDVVGRSRTGLGLTALRRHQEPQMAESAQDDVAGRADALESTPKAVLERMRWQQQYAGLLRVSDTVVIVAAVMLAHYVRFGGTFTSGEAASRYVIAYSILISVMWLAVLAGFHTRSPKVIGVGLEEYRLIITASFATFGALAMAELIVKLEISRGYLAVALPAGTVGMVLSRWAFRKYVAFQRATGGYRTAVLAIGDREAAVHLAAELSSNAADGYHVVGICIPGYGPPRGAVLTVTGREIPVIGGETHALQAIRTWGADTVAVAGTGQLSIQGLRRFIWELEPMGVDLVVSPGVVDVAQSRLVMRPIAGLPLLQIEKPQYRGAKRFQKRAFDSCFALVALLATLPVLIMAAIAIKATSRGPVFYSSERIGIDGRPFSMLKLRTMVDGADRQFESLLARNECDGLLFKIRADPRVTPVGRVLRRFSIDELPQFVNVLRREMSVVGPRPPLRREVESYDCDVLRRLLVKPGVTGPWQVSGRSDLSWDRSVRLDLSYVDNWSMVGDMLIIAKTLRAVLQRKGAY
jgi:exopolysaccharide biosynthesis polyprenyl glycosylphosphotransferase